MKYIVSLIITLLIFLVSALSSQSRAQTTSQAKGYTLVPAYQDIELKKGEEKIIEIMLRNNTASAATFNLYALNYRLNDKGHIELFPRNNESFSYALASYIRIPQDSITVDPMASEKIQVTINDRQDLSPGGHYAGIVAQLAHESNDKLTNVTPALVGLILLRKTGGEIFNLSLTKVSWPYRIIHFGFPKEMTLTFQNEGNIHVAPRGRIEVRDIFSRQIYKGIINTSSKYVFPSSRRTLTIPLQKTARTFPIMIYFASIGGNDSLQKVNFTYKDTFIYISPIAILFPIFLVTSYIFIKRKTGKKK